MRALALLLMWASGFAGLGYQIAWTQQSALWIGHEAASMLAIVAAFFGGLAVGAWGLGARIERSARPARWYAGCELVIGLWGAALVLLMPLASRALLALIGAEPSALWQWSVAFGGTFLLLLPATAAMGATLPAMEKLLRAGSSMRSSIAQLYAANTLGAVSGVLAAAFLLVPALGFTATTLICVGLNLFCAAVAWQWRGVEAATPPLTASGSLAPLHTLALTGLLGIGYEVLVVRALSQVAENTIFTFALLLAVYLVGTAAGAAAYARSAWLRSLGTPALLRAQALACLLGFLTLWLAMDIRAALLGWLGAGMTQALVAEALLATAAFLLPTLVMGALFSHLAIAAREAGVSFGKALGVNTLAAALAPLVLGVWLLPALGTSFALLLVAAGYLLPALLREWKSPWQAATVAAILALAWWHPPVAAVALPDGGRVLSHAEGVSATVSVVQDANGVATLHINNRQQEGSSVTLYSDARQGLLPLLLHPSPRNALFLGLGTGATVRAAALDTELRVDAVELLPEVIAAFDTFARLQESPAQPNLRLLPADARRFVRAATEHYDVIVSDNFHPARSGSAALYTVEHFAAVRQRLAPGGLFCQWLPLHQLDLDTTRSIVRSYLQVYPQAWAVIATNSLDTPVLGLIARRDGEALSLAQIQARLAAPRAQLAGNVDLGDELGLLGNFVGGPASLAAFSSGAPLNTDDHPVVAWLAPRITYLADSTPRQRLLSLLVHLQIRPDELFAANGDLNSRLARYWSARNHYLDVGAQIQPSRDVGQMLGRVRVPLLSVLEISPEFRPAYDPLVRMARDYARVDREGARRLLATLASVSPQWPEAREALGSIQP